MVHEFLARAWDIIRLPYGILLLRLPGWCWAHLKRCFMAHLTHLAQAALRLKILLIQAPNNATLQIDVSYVFSTDTTAMTALQ